MRLETLKAHCFYLYSALHIPIYIIEDRGGNDAARHVIIEAFPEQEACCHPLEILKRIHFPDERNVLFLTSSFSAGFGIIRIVDSKYTLIVGPQFAVPFSNPVYLEISKKYSFDAEQKGLIYAFFNGIPVASSLALKQTLRMMHHFLNPGLDEEIVDVFDEEETDKLRKNLYGEYYEMQEGGYHNNSVAVEREVCKIVEQGDVAAFTKFVRNVPYLSAGITSSSPLRQKKNLAIISIAVLTRAAIRGGMDENAALLLSDNYIRHVENSFTDKQIDSIQIDMFSRYVHVVSDIRAEKEASHTMETVVQYVREHVNQPVTVQLAAARFGFNPDYLSHKFKSGMGIGLKQFIKRTKLEEAARLLQYTNQNILEISNYLCFSSQSNFQNAFKQQYHLTPKQYREMTRRDIKEIGEIKGIKGAGPLGGGNGSPGGNGGCHGTGDEQE